MTGTTKASGRPASAASRKNTTKPRVAKTPAGSASPRKPAKAEVKTQVTEVAELTASDLAVSQEKTTIKPAPAAAPAGEKDKAPPAVKAVTETAEKAVQKGKETMTDVLETTKKYADEAKEKFQTAFSDLSEKAKAGVEKSSKAFSELGDMTKGNVEALVESGKVASKGMEAMGQEAAEYGRMTFEKATAAMKSMAAVKSPAEFFQLQSELMSSSFDSFAKEGAKASEAWLKLAGDVVKPISTRVSVVTEKVRSLAS